ncbi:hypothetical protein GCM10011611_03670 [Aliidongia dinghuensis]|uniref:Thioredoxin domain-containing protein n=1 Tax=Aliidongia dinghuensis TaxID=1867774 RepID=A0A8J2YQL6_9PROT|nr:redoxin domain-containing protein [Aliidongia dinghuensis]GGF01400.1 hypothetical protein GCM10011611_03670 [Aliidongia dinghuensis]
MVELDVTRSAVKAGQIAPDFALPEVLGGTVVLQHLLERGPAIICFQRSPFDSAAFEALSALQPEVAQHGATIVVIVPPYRAEAAGPDLSSLPFPAGQDHDGKVARAYGLDLARPHPSGQSRTMPATYVVDRDGRIVLSLIDTTCRDCIEPRQLLAALAGLRRRREHSQPE